MERIDWEEAEVERCAWKEQCEAAVPQPGAKEKQRGRKQTLLRVYLPIFTVCRNGSPFPFLFLQGGGSRKLLVALPEAQAVPEPSGGSLQHTCETLLNPTHLQRASPWQGEHPLPCPSPFAQCLLLGGHRGAEDTAVRHLSPGDKQGSELYFCFHFPPQQQYLTVVWGSCSHHSGHPQHRATCLMSITLSPAQGTRDSCPCLPWPALCTGFNC